jgi:hypothetical protein
LYFFVSCQKQASNEHDRICSEEVPALKTMLAAAPEVRAQKAITRGDLKYLEWYGFVSAIPGVVNQQCARTQNIIKPFIGTSDVLCTSEHKKLYELSYPFAEKYNKAISVQREVLKLQTCQQA